MTGKLPDRLASRIAVAGDGCWHWVGSRDRDGYGYLHQDKAHRLVYVAMVGPIPEGYHVHHECLVRWCVNPAHLLAIDGRINAGMRRNARFCRNGHPYESDCPVAKDGTRRCPICAAATAERQRAAIRERRGQSPRPKSTAVACAHGHPWTPETLRVYVYSTGQKVLLCKVCEKKRYLARKRGNAPG